MVFSSLTFIFYFLVMCLISYYIIPKKFIKVKNIILLIFSLLFYSWGEPEYIFLMLFSVLISYSFGLLINYFNFKNNKKFKLLAFVISVVLIIFYLIYFKYTNFFLYTFDRLFHTSFGVRNIVLPIGISFYTFQILSYLIDLYRNKITVQKNIFNLALYISFFPQLIAGPIVTYQSIEKQLTNRKESLDKFSYGLERFILGLSKKVIISNQMAVIADAVFNASDISNLSVLTILLGTLSYTYQIYFDFSGYSDMAIGLGKLFGFDFLENFDYPYMAISITDFWRRWHISLTTFFREYIYFPLGGNRVSKKRWLLNMFIVWILTGFWHGASWTFILWGLYYYVLLVLEKTVFKNILNRVPKIIRYLGTFIFINIGWIIFRANSFSDLIVIFKSIIVNNGSVNLSYFISSNSDIIFSLPFLIVAIFGSFNIIPKFDEILKNSFTYFCVKKVFVVILFIISISFLVNSMYNPFIYFRF